MRPETVPEEQQGAAGSFAPHRGAAITLAAGLAASLALWHYSGDHLAREAEERFRDQSELVQNGIRQRMNDYKNVVLGAQGLFLASSHISRDEFHAYYENLRLRQHLPGVQSLSFTRLVPHSRKAAFIAGVRRDTSLGGEGSPDFDIHPPGDRPGYFVVDYIEPIAETRRAIGLDANTQPASQEGFAASRENGKMTITPPFSPVEASGGPNHLILRAPVYLDGAAAGSIEQRRAAFSGFVGISMNSDELFGDFLAAQFLEGLRVIIRDGGLADAGQAMAGPLVFDTGAGRQEPAAGAAPLTRSAELRVADRTWRIDFIAEEAWLSKRPDRNLPWLLLSGGAAISLLLAALFFALARANASAIGIAAKMTRDLRQSEQRFRQLAEMSTDWFWEQDAEARFIGIIGSAKGQLPLSLEQIRGKTRWEVYPDAFTPEEWAAHRRQLAAREPYEMEYPVTGEDGRKRWLQVRGAPRYDSKGGFLGFHGSAKDVTESKLAMEEIASKSAVLRATFENMAQGISVVDRELRLIGYNPRFLELLGFPDSFVHEGISFEDFIRYNAERGDYGPGDIEELVRARLELARRFEPHRIKRTRPNGIVLEIVGTPLPGGGFVTTYTDVTEQERVEEALRRQSAVLQTTLDHLEQGISVMDADLHMMAMNRRFCELLDFPEEMARDGAPFEDFFRYNAKRGEYGPGDIEKMVREQVELARRFEPHRFKRVRPNGRIIEVRGTPIAGGGFVTSYTDITEQERAQEALRQSEQRYRTLVEMSPDAVFAHRKRIILLANEATLRLWGLPPDGQVIGRDVIDFIAPESRADVIRRIEALESEETPGRRVPTTEQIYRRADGSAVPVESSATRIELADGPAVLSVIRDISDRKLAEDALRQFTETLEQRVRERTADLEASNQELESFSYSVSHDLRAPLRALHGFSHLLEEEYSRCLDENGLNYLHRIRSASERMGKLIDDMIGLARISRQDLRRVDVDLTAVATEIAQTLQEQAPQRKVRWHIAPGMQAKADPGLANVLLDNLLGNAWKFTAECDEALIEFGLQRTGDGKAFYVRDNGAGFDMNYADKLFQPFQRLHNPKRFEGTGIGLATVQRIVRRHGGHIRAESTPGMGATFSFTLS